MIRVSFSLLQLTLAFATATVVAVPQAPEYKTAKVSIVQRDDNQGFVSIPLIRRQKSHTNIHKRDNDVPLYNVSSVSYLLELGIGNPSQNVLVAIDTGSDELWVNPDCTTAGSDTQEKECYDNGVYEPDDSSTSVQSSVQNYIPYGKGEVRMSYVADNITLRGSTLKLSQQIFGVAISSIDLYEGILGLGYGKPLNLDYPNFIDSLFLQNQTNTRAFSIALGSKDHDNGGTLIFGGVDTKKYVGDLVSVPILDPQLGEGINRYWITLDSVNYRTGSGSMSLGLSSVPIVLDSGSTLSYLPNSVVTAMGEELNGQKDAKTELWVVPCRSAQTSNTMDFTFGDATIQVPMYEFIWQVDDNVCVLGAIGISDNSVSLLGDSMMRAGYFVFDQENKAIHMAQYAYCGENEKAIPVDGDAASFSGECSEEDTDLNLTSSNNNNDDDDDDSGVAGRTRGVGLAAVVSGAIVTALL